MSSPINVSTVGMATPASFQGSDDNVKNMNTRHSIVLSRAAGTVNVSLLGSGAFLPANTERLLGSRALALSPSGR